MKTHKEHCIAHAIKRFEQRFTKKDFIYKSKKMGKVDFKNEVAAAIVNAPKTGKSVKGGRGFRNIFKVKIMDTKPVFVVWDMEYSIPVTVLTGEMWSETCG